MRKIPRPSGISTRRDSFCSNPHSCIMARPRCHSQRCPGWDSGVTPNLDQPSFESGFSLDESSRRSKLPGSFVRGMGAACAAGHAGFLTRAQALDALSAPPARRVPTARFAPEPVLAVARDRSHSGGTQGARTGAERVNEWLTGSERPSIPNFPRLMRRPPPPPPIPQTPQVAPRPRPHPAAAAPQAVTPARRLRHFAGNATPKVFQISDLEH